ncbi:MAG: hypothetical protein ABFD70_11190 [Syntrophaceae bacterium]|nr:hypothetical protein [Deltaproteobacteria bacterium]
MRSTIARPLSGNMIAAIMGFSLCFMTVSLPSFAATQWNVGISGGNEGIDGFSLSIGEYYRVPEREVVVIHDRGIDEDELPVVFYIAQRAQVDPEEVVDLRLSGMSWMDITLYFGLSPEIYYVPVVIHRYAPPYGNAYGYYHNHPRGGWKRNDLRDRDIVNQVNLKFISEHHRYAPERIMRYRSEGRSFTAIDRDISTERHGHPRYQGRKDTNRNAYRQNPYGQNRTGQDQQRQIVTRPNQYKQNDSNQNQARQEKKIRTASTKPNQYKQHQYDRNKNRQNEYVQSIKDTGKVKKWEDD